MRIPSLIVNYFLENHSRKSRLSKHPKIPPTGMIPTRIPLASPVSIWIEKVCLRVNILTVEISHKAYPN